MQHTNHTEKTNSNLNHERTQERKTILKQLIIGATVSLILFVVAYYILNLYFTFVWSTKLLISLGVAGVYWGWRYIKPTKNMPNKNSKWYFQTLGYLLRLIIASVLGVFVGIYQLTNLFIKYRRLKGL